jgi:hypothetical protein
MENIQYYWQVEIQSPGHATSPEEPINYMPIIEQELRNHYGLERCATKYDTISGMVVTFHFPTLELCANAKPYFDECTKKYHLSSFNAEMYVVISVVSSDTPLLKYLRGSPVKKLIWDCQKELIDSGFEGNARW